MNYFNANLPCVHSIMSVEHSCDPFRDCQLDNGNTIFDFVDGIDESRSCNGKLVTLTRIPPVIIFLSYECESIYVPMYFSEEA